MIQATDGNFYGTTLDRGANAEGGTVFEITPAGTLTTLYNFCSQTNCTDGSVPVGSLVQGTDGNFYGTTQYGGTNVCSGFSPGCGTAFKVSPTGALTVLHSFDSTFQDPDGLFQATNGAFYGITLTGGTSSDGIVFALAVGLGPFVETVPTSGTVGARVRILGNDLTAATSVTFNGTPATFKVRSSSEIGTTVPEGATSGIVEVTRRSAR